MEKKKSRYNWDVVFNFVPFESQEQRDLHYNIFVKSIFCLKNCDSTKTESTEEAKAAYEADPVFLDTELGQDDGPGRARK